MKIMFICTGNSFRSIAAESLAKKYKPQHSVYSGGTHPAESVAWNVKELLEEDGVPDDLIKSKPDFITQKKLDKADLIVVMSSRHKEHLLNNFNIKEEKIENWDVRDPIDPNVEARNSFNKIKEQIQQLS